MTYSKAKIFDCQSARRLLDSIGEELVSGRSVIIGMPSWQSSYSLWTLLKEANPDIDSREVWVDVGARTPLEAITQDFDLNWPPRTPRTIANLIGLLQVSPNPPAVIGICGVDELDDTTCTMWFSALQQWHAETRRMTSENDFPIALCMMTSAQRLTDAGITTNASLDIRHWVGSPSVLELQLLCRSRSNSMGQLPRDVWREYLIPAIAAWDYRLVDVLWDEIFDNFSRIEETLREFAMGQSWDLHDEFVGNRRLIDHSEQVGGPGNFPAPWAELWQIGAAGWTPEFGLELSPGALVMLGFSEECRHRVWRGQAQLLLPHLNRVRMSICDALRSFLGQDWATRWCEPLAEWEATQVYKNPMASEWGHLLNITSHATIARDLCDELYPLIRKGRDLRNQVAHHQIVEFFLFDQFISDRKRLETVQRQR